MKSIWQRFQGARGVFRWPIKVLVIGAAAFLVSFPNPVRFVRHVGHWRAPDRLIDLDEPLLVPLVEEANRLHLSDLPPEQVLSGVESLVIERIKYDWDWNTWGAADYLPTLREVLETGREDCDGRAVAATAVLRKLGYDADIVTDLTHVWVRTDFGDTMGPGQHGSSVVTDEQGIHIKWWEAIRHLALSWSYGLAVFPRVRELIVLAVIWLLLLRPGLGLVRSVIGACALVVGLFLVCHGGITPYQPQVWAQWLGSGTMIAAIVGMSWLGKRRMRKTEAPA
jgi:hypothetical protein